MKKMKKVSKGIRPQSESGMLVKSGKKKLRQLENERKEEDAQGSKDSGVESGGNEGVSASTASPVQQKDEEENGEISSNAENAGQLSADATVALEKIMVQADQAIDVLLQIADRKKGTMLFPEVDQALDVQCIYKKPSFKNPGILNKKILLPHSFHDDAKTTVCLIMADLDKSSEARRDPDVDKQARLWEDKLLEEHGITKKHVQKVMTVTQFAREYQSFNDRRQLATAYDLFLADSRVVKTVSNKCGKEFYKKRKLPISVDLTKGHLIEQIKKANRTILLPLSANRTRTSLHIGHLGQKKADVLDNMREAISCLFKFCPGGLANVRSLYTRITSFGPNLPIYADTGSANEIQFKAPDRKIEEQEEVTEEITTLPEGLEVKVRKGGKIRVVDSETKKTVTYPTITDEWEEQDDIKPVDPEKRAEKKTAKKKRIQKRRQMKQKDGDFRVLKRAFASVTKDALKSDRKKSAEGKAGKKIKKIVESAGKTSMGKVVQKPKQTKPAKRKVTKKKLEAEVGSVTAKRRKF